MGTYSNHYKYQLANKAINLGTDSIKALLMQSTFTFNPDTHATYADVLSDELATGNGYTQNTKVLTGQSLTEDDANNMGVMTADDVEWTAVGGDIGPVSGILFYDDTSSDNTVIGFQAFGAATTAITGEKISGTNISLQIG